MLRLSSPARLVACVLVVALLGLWSWSVSPARAGSVDTGLGDARFQLLPGAQDPDDDDDGVADEDDPAPEDPGNVPPEEEPDITSPVQDGDGDGLPNVQDPDDDNGGVADDEDPAPFDPDVEPPPPSDPLSPVHDDDGDGIPNVQDPDDDNDGASDDADPDVPAPDPAPAVPDAPTGVGDNAAVGGGGDVPVVTSLPVTGSGREEGSVALLVLIAGSAALLGGALLHAGWRRGAG